MLTAEGIRDIVEREVAKPEFERFAPDAMLLYERWLKTPDDVDFCVTDIMPHIERLGKSQRRKARKLLTSVKEHMSESAALAARTHAKQRHSANAMHDETLKVYDLIQRKGRGFVHMGSARTKPGSLEYEQQRELAREMALLFPDSTTWSGAGPGQMDAPLQGAMEVGKKRGGIKIEIGNIENGFEQAISRCLADDDVVTCKYFAPRKVGLVDAGMRLKEEDRTAFVYGPGGFGTLDEFFEVLTLEQLKKLGYTYKVPILLMNYQSFYDNLLRSFDDMLKVGTINERDLALLKVCTTNEAALAYLADFYDVPKDARLYASRLQNWDQWKRESATDEVTA